MRTKAERTLDVITRKDTSYLPSQIAFATGTGKQKVVDAMGFHTWDEFDEYLDNHYHMTCQMDDVVCWYCGDVEKTRLAEKHGCARIDWGTNRVWDRWEMEFDVYAPSGFFNYGHPWRIWTKRCWISGILRVLTIWTICSGLRWKKKNSTVRSISYL